MTDDNPLGQVLLGAGVDLLIALLGVVPAYLIGDRLEIYPVSLSVALAAVLLGIALITALILTKENWPNRMAWGTGAAALLVTGAYAALLVAQPWCHVDAVTFEVEPEGVAEPVAVFGGETEAAPGATIRVRAMPSTDEAITCRWEYRGDGALASRDGCTALVQVGVDPTADILSVTARQPSCRRLLISSLFIRGEE